jgi:hypothetical protein
MKVKLFLVAITCSCLVSVCRAQVENTNATPLSSLEGVWVLDRIQEKAGTDSFRKVSLPVDTASGIPKEIAFALTEKQITVYFGEQPKTLKEQHSDANAKWNYILSENQLVLLVDVGVVYSYTWSLTPEGLLRLQKTVFIEDGTQYQQKEYNCYYQPVKIR